MTEALSQAFWHARVGGQCRAAEYLLRSAADLTWLPTMHTGPHCMQPRASGLSERR